jgi:hypothetical protein
MQRSQLLHHEEQKDHNGPAGVQEVLPEVPQAHAAQRGEVRPLFAVRHSPRTKSEERKAKNELRVTEIQGRKLNG